jgi:undecaprenyl-diphosphatase
VPRRRALTALSAASAAGFAALTWLVAATGDVPGDQPVLRALRSATGDRYDGALRVLDQATDSRWLLVLTALLAAAVVRAGRRRPAVLLAVSVVGAVAVNPLWKALVDRPRPELLPPLADVSALSFPSGHATGTAALALAAVLATAGTRAARAVAVAAAALVVLTAVGQLGLAHHHPSDLLGGWLWATAWTAAVWSAGTPTPSFPRG